MMDRSNDDGQRSSLYGRGSGNYGNRVSRGGEDITDILVPPLSTSSMSQQNGFANGSNHGERGNGDESSDSRKWSSLWKSTTKQSNEAIQAGPVASCGASDNLYNMNHLSRGKCIIFNHSVFDKSQNLGDRKGTNVDVESIKKTFNRFGFTVDCYEDLTYNKLMLCLKAVSNEDHSHNDCLVVFVLTHGIENQLHAFDIPYKPSQLWSFFTADKCSTLAGKPKMFFMQACRGDGYDDGTRLHRFSRTQVDGPSKDESAYRIPNQADFLTVYSTYEAEKENIDFLRFTMQYLSLGFYSWRNSINGGCFIQALCKVFSDCYVEKDVLSMLTIVNREVAISYESRSKDPAQNMKKQIPHVCHTLMREVYLAPKFQSTLV